MATYTCNQCDMSVNANCAKCDKPLNNSSITTDEGVEKFHNVQVAKE